MRLQMGRGDCGLSNRMEAGLAAWLHGFEPATTPIDLRLGVFADLRAKAERPRRRFAGLMPALSSTASLALVVLGSGLVLALAIAGASLGDAIGSPAQPYPGGQAPLTGEDWVAARGPYGLIVLLVLSSLAGGSVLLRRVRAVASRLAFGKGAPEPAAPLPLRRPWRSIPRLTWFVAALTIAVILLAVLMAARNRLPSGDPYELLSFLSFCSQIVATPFALVVAWRYPRHDRSSNLLLLFALASLASLLWYGVSASFGAYWPWSFGLLMVLAGVGTIALTAGLAGRCGSVRRPPLRLAALGVGGTLFLVAYSWAELLVSVGDPGWLEIMVITAQAWFVAASALAILWIGLDACRRGGSRAWWLVLAAGTLQVSFYSFYLLGGIGFAAASQTSDERLALMIQGWMALAATLSTAALLAALLIGLRPVPPDEAQPADSSGPGKPARSAPEAAASV